MNFDVKEQAQLVYEFDIKKGKPDYIIDNSSHVPKGTFHRVAYYVQLQHPQYGNQWVYTAFDAFTDDPHKIGIPYKGGEAFVFKQDIHNLVVKSSSSSLVNKCSKHGSILFTAYDYGEDKTTMKCCGNYGAMQVHSNDTVIWAYNHMCNKVCDIGIGPNVFSDDCQRDWTFTENGDEYTIKHMKIYILYNEVKHQNELSYTSNMRINMKGVAHGDYLSYNSVHRLWGVPQVPYTINRDAQNMPNFIIALSGQSNSQGWNTQYDAANWKDQPHERIYGFNSTVGKWEIADLNTQSLGASWHKAPGWQCLAFHFAHRLVEAYSDIKPGIINVGIGGQAICRWAKFNQDDPWYKFNCDRALAAGVSQGDIFDLHAGLIDNALAICGGKVDVICWHQGESDCDVHGGNAGYYKRSLETVVKQYRALNWCNETTPFIVGETTSESRNVQLHEIASVDNYMRCVQTMDLPKQKEDPIHFNAKAQRTLGSRYFKAYRSIFEE